MSAYHTQFKGVTNFNDTLLSNKLEINLKSWFEYSLLKIGAWSNVSGSNTDIFGNDAYILRQVKDPTYPNQTVYESIRKDWVWENVQYEQYSPLIPQIYVGGQLVIPDHINYPLGRVIFSSAKIGVVSAKYSYRNVQIYIADDVPWWRSLQYDLDNKESQFSRLSDGSWGIGSNHRVQMPCLIIEAVPRCISRPYQLGDGSAWVEQDILVHVLAENRRDRNNLVDILRGQFDAHFWLFDNDYVAQNGLYALDYKGEVINRDNHYLGLISESESKWKSCRIIRTEVSESETINARLFEGIVRLTCEFVLED